ncbi:MAG: family 20 glycosylhydrolase [Muribaculaceae bacterium]|nr:family 20 glycosylhydrolase [Muribaculaceae bacterium]
MKPQILKLLSAATALGAALSLHAENTITWETLGNERSADYGNYYIQRFVVESDAPFDRLAFCAFKRGLHAVNPADSVIEILPGYFVVASERFRGARPGKPVVVELRSDGALRNISFAPDGMHLVCDGKPVAARNVRKPITSWPAQYQVPGENGSVDRMIYAPEAFAINDSLRSDWRPGPYMAIPTPKKVKLSGRYFDAPEKFEVKYVKVKDRRNDYYRARVDGPRLTIYTNSSNPEALAARLVERIKGSADASGKVPAAEIEDWADLSYRGLMIDVARNFTSKDDMKRLIDLMAAYGLNVLHFHVGDDEGWRVEIPELPELTETGSRRGYTTDDNVPFLKGIYSGDGNPHSSTPANGHYSVNDYVELLRYAAERGIDIIPEFDTPGHSRAAIRAMEYRYRRTGDASLRLIHDGDSSRYTTAQDFHDNIMNPALEGPYRFWTIVMESLIDTYKKAGVPLRAIHIGGDEVPAHAWDGSGPAMRLMAEKGMTHQRELHAWFVERVAAIAAEKGVKIAGWQEIALDHSPQYNATVQPVVEAVNCWTNAGDFGPQIASQGFPLILSNVDYLYFDQTPTTHPEEPGLVWGGIVDEFRPLHATVDRLCPGDAATQARVAGISGQLFSETVRSRAMIERYILPRILGLAERAHNVSATLTDSEYFGTLTGEMEKWAADGRDHYLRQPGIRDNGGMIEMNDAYGFGEIRYTLDGSEPTAVSPLYTAPFSSAGIRQVRARLFHGPAASVTSVLYID